MKHEESDSDNSSGLLKSYPIDYGRTITRLLHREIKSYFDLVKFLNLT